MVMSKCPVEKVPVRGRALRKANAFKVKLERSGMTYARLVEKPANIGNTAAVVNFTERLHRGKFSNPHILLCVKTIGATDLQPG